MYIKEKKEMTGDVRKNICPTFARDPSVLSILSVVSIGLAKQEYTNKAMDGSAGNGKNPII